MTIHSYVEALLKYAEEFLLLDSLDESYIRERAYSLLNLGYPDEEMTVDVEDLEEMASPALIVNKIMNYALESGIVSAEETELFKARLMDCFVKRPSEIQEIFTSIAAKNAGKAVSWIQDYNVKSGFTSEPIKRWEARSTKGKLEVSFLPQKSKAEVCKFCHDIEGHGIYRNLRVAPLEIDGTETYYIPSKYPKFNGQGYLALAEHKPLALNEKTLGLMVKFLASTAGHFVAFKPCDCQKKHGHLVVGEKLLPIMKAEGLTQLKNKEYPYITLWLVDWYVPTIRMSSSTPDKLIEFALKTISAWNLPCGVAMRKHDNIYVLDLILTGNKEVKAKNAGLIRGKLDFAAFMGAFALDNEIYEDALKIEKLLTKELNLKTAGNLDHLEQMIQKLMKEVGTAKLSPIEAALDVKEIINHTLEEALKDVAVFPVGSEELLVMIEQMLDIKKHI